MYCILQVLYYKGNLPWDCIRVPTYSTVTVQLYGLHAP